MTPISFSFPGQEVQCYLNQPFSRLSEIIPPSSSVIITDYHVYKHHHAAMAGYPVIKIPAGETHKTQQSVDYINEQLLKLEAGKDTWLIAVGGGVVTDITGLVSVLYKRGTNLALVPTSLLAMVDAAVGGKNGINTGIYKNIVGSIRQPAIIWYDFDLLRTLPAEEWVNGMAEVIKHACIQDELLFRMLEQYNIHDIQTDLSLVESLVERNIRIKMKIVAADEKELGERKLLNFGHTIGHAIENLHHIPHGHAVSMGMVAMCNLAVRLNMLEVHDAVRIVKLLSKYHLPVDLETDLQQVYQAIRQDKKRASDQIQLVLLKKIGEAFVYPLPVDSMQEHLKHIMA